jgi:hypothetical protein
MAPGMMLISPGSMTRGLDASPLTVATTFSSVSTLTMRVMTYLESASCAMGGP